MQDDSLFIGVRVVRGADWAWGDQDGFEGLVGTVANPIFGKGNVICNGTVFVQWDTGGLANYRVGRFGAFDLRMFDTTAAGIFSALSSSCH